MGLILMDKFPNGKRFAHFVENRYVTAQFVEKLSPDIILMEIGGIPRENCKVANFDTLEEWFEWAERNLGFIQTEDEKENNIRRLVNGDVVQLA